MRFFRGMGWKKIAVAAALALVMASACACGVEWTETTTIPASTLDTEPLVTPGLTPAATENTSGSREPALPTANPDREANLYVLGVYISKAAYVAFESGETMLPLQETIAELAIDYERSVEGNEISLSKSGAVFAQISQSEDGSFVIVSDDDELNGRTVNLQEKGDTVYAPVEFFEQIAKVDYVTNDYGDVFLKMRPEPTQSPAQVLAPDGNEGQAFV